MKNYLDLVPISAGVHKKQSRMSVFCIILAVFLVTAIFGMADMFIRGQILLSRQRNGNWHIAIKNISAEDAAIIAVRPDMETLSPYGAFNYRGDLGYTLGGKNVVICGSDESYISEICIGELEEGVFPQARNEALITENVRDGMGLQIGDSMTVQAPDDEELTFTVSGILKNAANLMSRDAYAVFLKTEDYLAIYPDRRTEGGPTTVFCIWPGLQVR